MNVYYSKIISIFKIKLIYQKLATLLTNTKGFGLYFEPIIQLFFPYWKANRINAKVTGVRFENSSIYTLVIKPDAKWRPFKAGQFIQLSAEIKGALITRTFSISSEPDYYKTEGKIEITIRSQDKGLFTPWLRASIKIGNTVYISQASGEFILKNHQPNKLFIAAGSGITAIRPILKQYQHKQWLKDATLLFYVKNKSERLFLKDLIALESSGLYYKFIYSEDSGRISQQHLQAYCGDLNHYEAYICGPPNMIDATKSLLLNNGLAESDIYYEYFGLPSYQTPNVQTDSDDTFIQVDYLHSNRQSHVKSTTTPQTLLDLSEKEGLNPLSGCRTGVCHQCICKKKQGRVFNIKTQKYSDSGSEEIQLCLSVPAGHVQLEL